MKFENLLICVKCKHKMKKAVGRYTCTNCNFAYKTVNDIPIAFDIEVESNEINEFWDDGWANRTQNSDLKWIKNKKNLEDKFTKNLKSLISDGHTIVDAQPFENKCLLNIGCGVGEGPILALMGLKNYIGLDFSFNAVNTTSKSLKTLSKNNFKLVQANAEALPFKDNSIDIVYSNGVLHHTPNTAKAFSELIRVLKPNGRAIIGLYSTYSPHFINSKIIGFVSSIIQTKNKGLKWYESGESAWRTSKNTNPWTKTYSVNEIRKILSKFNVYDIAFRKNNFSWENAVPLIGGKISRTRFGKATRRRLDKKFGSLIVSTFKKK